MDEGKTCPGYRDKNGTSLRAPHPVNTSRDRRWKQAKAAQSTSVDEIQPLETDKALKLSPDRYAVLRYPLAESWNDHLIPLVTDKFSFDVDNCVYNVIPDIAAKDAVPFFNMAVNAVGSAYITDMASPISAVPDPIKSYKNALHAVAMALSDPKQSTHDSTIAGVWLLAFYEVSQFKAKFDHLTSC